MPHLSTSHQSFIPGNQRGVALVGAFLVLLVVFAAAAVLATQTFTAGHVSERQEHHTRALYAAEAGIAWAEQAVFNDWGVQNSGTANDTMQSFQARLNGNFNLPADLGGGAVTVPDGAGPVPLFANYLLPNSSATVQQVTVARADTGATQSLFTVNSTGADAFGNTRQVTSLFQIAGQDVNYNDFALLAKNITCIMCHTRIDNVDRYYNSSAGFNDESRVKIGSLESMIVRDSSADTQIAGTLYLQGTVTNKNGDIMTAGSWESSTIDANPFDVGSNNIVEDGSGNLSVGNLINAPIDPGTGLPVGSNNLYMNYSSDPAEQKQIDGELPTDFFTIFEDLNGDRMVSVADVDATKSKFTGEISGGVILDVPLGGTYASGSLPGSGNVAKIGDKTVSGGTYHSGNVVMVGTDANPIVLDGAVGVHGDVMVSGVVQGQGEIYASGNVYIVGDVTYKNDAGLPWGHYTDGGGNATRNALFVGSGNNILIGDYLTPKGGDLTNVNQADTGNHQTSPGFSFTMSEIAMFNRSEWAKTQPLLPDWEEGNNPTVPNPNYDPNYQPVYFNMGPGEPVYIYNMGYTSGKGSAKGTHFDANTLTWQGKEHPGDYRIHEDFNYNQTLDPGEDVDGDGQLDTGSLTMLTEGEAVASGASISSYNPAWISTSNLKSIWNQVETNRVNGQAFQIDAAMRTSQSIFALSRSNSKYGTKTRGQLTVNGAIIASHVGILSPGDKKQGVNVGLQLNYDRIAATASEAVTSENPSLRRVARWYK